MSKTVIRLGAAHWDATIPTNDGPLHFDFRAMSKDDRRKFHAAFMASYRKLNPMKRRTAPLGSRQARKRAA